MHDTNTIIMERAGKSSGRLSILFVSFFCSAAVLRHFQRAENSRFFQAADRKRAAADCIFHRKTGRGRPVFLLFRRLRGTRVRRQAVSGLYLFAKPVHRVGLHAVHPHLKMAVIAGGIARVAHIGDHLALADRLARADRKAAALAIEGLHPAAVVDDDVDAVAGRSTGTSCFFSSGEIRQSDRLLSVDAFKLIIAVSLMERWLVTEN